VVRSQANLEIAIVHHGGDAVHESLGLFDMLKRLIDLALAIVAPPSM
jgi:hypothetical protein